MLSHLDYVIFPDRCEVIEIIPSQRYFYPIYKNGSSSVLKQATISKWRIYLNEKIKKISSIDTVIREPRQRFVSGINSFVTQTTSNNPSLDRDTVFWFAKTYLHLNRHYCMQYAWLLNLARYINPETKINLLNLDIIKQITDLTMDPWGHKDKTMSDELADLSSQEMYLRIDQVLFDAVGQSLTFAEINQLIKTRDPEAYKQVILRSQNILKPTYVVSQT